ncbi:hypothetical protein PV08_01980 [Exophiala spinifera]|uniref:Uncharacterized protein n=1 Tax=Exophiala spinifera TaxID=91928 RepID=A0A0D2BSJ5_9EURO|nr:uncharacterized protein PV08_01980 [Exophiala spinifera]KIW21400.1 hypothetical protein PV08_01980 [Exophiala spinifera]
MQRFTKIALTVTSLALIVLSLAFLEVTAPEYSIRNSSQSISDFVSTKLGQVSGKQQQQQQQQQQHSSYPHGDEITLHDSPSDSSNSNSSDSGSASASSSADRTPDVGSSGYDRRRRYAYATFYSSPANDTRPLDEDKYFTATRVLLYQLLHHPATRSTNGYPLLVLVPNHVDARKTDILKREGAVVVHVDVLNPDDASWVHPARASWAEQFTKLRLFTLTEFDRIAFVDSDMLLITSLDGMFDEDVVQTPAAASSDGDKVRADEGPLPRDYVFVGVSDAGGPHRDSVPDEHDNVNGGFWVMRPDPVLYRYYLGVMNLPGRFDDSTMEQGLLNYAHRAGGPMPYRHFQTGKWNMNWPSYGDVERGAASVHDKFWDEGNAGWIDRQLVEMWWRMQGEMEGFWFREQQDGLY